MRIGGAALAAAGAILLAAACKGQGEKGWGGAGRQAAGRPSATDAGGDAVQREARAGVSRGALEEIQGTVARAGPDAIDVDSPDGGHRTFRIAPGTSLLREGRPIAASALRPGIDVRASYRDRGDGAPAEAVSIEVLPRDDHRTLNGKDTSTVNDPAGGGAHGAQGGAPGAPGGANPGAPSPRR